MTMLERTPQPVTLLQRERPMRPDLALVGSYIALSVLGLLMVYTASAPRLIDLGVNPTQDLERQGVFVVAGFIAFGVVSAFDVRYLRRWVPVVYAASMLTLLFVLTPLGRSVQGAQRWIDLGPLGQFQPAELAKVAVIVALAALLALKPLPLRWPSMVWAVVVVAVPALLIFLQPDLGTMLAFGIIAMVILFVAGATWRQMAAMLVTATVGAVALFQVGAIRTYQIERLTAFLDVNPDVLGTQYNLQQSEIAIGTGGLLGKGLFNGTQTNLRFVPEQSSDFIFTAVGEQLGFVGAIIVLSLFGILLWRVLVASLHARDRFGLLVAVGTAALITFHVFVNVGMTVGVMPITGLPLPFMSAGGTAFIAMSIALGMAHSVWLRRSPVPGENTFGQVQLP
ncbi:MAG: rod shape-determining protein RodA [Acidimicrobiia bacterium]|nr:MAG: rod shape-determining protein RodA [Acidimicrobiia bacterium]